MALTDRDREIAEAISEQSAQAVTSRLLTAATDPLVAERVIDAWGGHLQRVVGRAVLRLLLYLLVTIVFIGSFRLGLGEKIADLFKEFRP